MDNLNAFLQPQNAPVSDTSGAISGYQVATTFFRNSVSPNKIAFLPINKITAGTITVAYNLGSNTGPYLLLDGANNRIIVNDGTVNRIIIGSL